MQKMHNVSKTLAAALLRHLIYLSKLCTTLELNAIWMICRSIHSSMRLDGSRCYWPRSSHFQTVSDCGTPYLAKRKVDTMYCSFSAVQCLSISEISSWRWDLSPLRISWPEASVDNQNLCHALCPNGNCCQVHWPFTMRVELNCCCL